MYDFFYTCKLVEIGFIDSLFAKILAGKKSLSFSIMISRDETGEMILFQRISWIRYNPFCVLNLVYYGFTNKL